MVPAMVIFYICVCLIIIFSNYTEIIPLFKNIFIQAFSPSAAFSGGFLGVLIQGMRRGFFSNESGVGTAAVAHAAAKTDEPIREGLVAMLGPFIDTIVICSMTALAILITKAHLTPGLEGHGAQITAVAFASVGPIMPYLLTLSTAIFAYSTMISYSYYADRAVYFLFGKKLLKPFQCLFLLCTLIAPTLSLGVVIDFSDLMLLSMAIPNIIGMFFLSNEVKVMVDHYWQEYKSGNMKTASELRLE